MKLVGTKRASWSLWMMLRAECKASSDSLCMVGAAELGRLRAPPCCPSVGANGHIVVGMVSICSLSASTSCGGE